MNVNGVWFPVITPFKNGEVDFASYERLLLDALNKGVHGVIPLGTTGESPTVSAAETEKIVKKTLEVVKGKVPVFFGCGGNNTASVVEKAKKYKDLGVDGILSVVPYYNKPGKSGLIKHFTSIADATDLKVILYNIPYRTCINMENDTIHELAKHDNIVGLKDSCGNFAQSMDLMVNKPANFSIFTGDDIMYFTTISHGGDGGILASSHIGTDKFVKIYHLVKEGKVKEAWEIWRTIANLIPLLFKEPNPTPIKYCLKELGLIDSDESRLPLTDITPGLKAELKKIL